MEESRPEIITPEHIMWHVDMLKYRTKVLGESTFYDRLDKDGNVVQLVWNKYMKALLKAFNGESLNRQELLWKCRTQGLHNPIFSEYLKNAIDCCLIEARRDRHDMMYELTEEGKTFITQF